MYLKQSKFARMKKEKRQRKKSSVRHTRAIQQNRSKHPVAMPTDEKIGERLQDIVHPATLEQVRYFHQLGLRERTLGLPAMVAFVLDMIWRQIGSVSELVRIIQSEAVLWEQPREVSQQALSLRLSSLPSNLFLNVLNAILPKMRERWMQRERPLPQEIAWAAERYRAVLAVDGSTLDALLRKIGLLKDLPKNPLAGKITALLDLCTRLPEKVWYMSDPKVHDQQFWVEILASLKVGSLLIFDKGYINYALFLELTRAKVKFITRSKKNMSYSLEAV